MRMTIGLSLALCASPALAQQAPAPASAPAQPEATSDPARVAAAERTVDFVFPVGSYERLMRGTLDKLTGSVLTTMMGLSPRKLGTTGNTDDESADTPFSQLANEADPYFEERMRLSMNVVTDEMIALMTEAEPAVRAALTGSYARRYTVAQLADMNAFFATPTGTVFARDYLLIYSDPEMIEAMQAFVPRMLEQLPTLEAKVAAATAHLPPAPGAMAADDGEEADDAFDDPDRWSARDRARVDRLDAASTSATQAWLNAMEQAAANARRADARGAAGQPH